MDTPIYDELARAGRASRASTLTEEPVGVPEDEASGRPVGSAADAAADPGPDTPHGAEEPAEREAASCYWCGAPIWPESPRYSHQSADGRTGDIVLLMACCPEHVAALQAHHDPSGA